MAPYNSSVTGTRNSSSNPGENFVRPFRCCCSSRVVVHISAAVGLYQYEHCPAIEHVFLSVFGGSNNSNDKKIGTSRKNTNNDHWTVHVMFIEYWYMIMNWI